MGQFYWPISSSADLFLCLGHNPHMVKLAFGVAILFFVIFHPTAEGKDLCEVFKWASCPSDVSSSYSRPSSPSNPSSGSSSSNNPGSLSVGEGLGIESIFYDKLDIGITSGNGRVGGSISSQNSEETFFGNIAKEKTSEFKARVEERSSYRGSKYALALATRLAGDKRRKYSKKPPTWILNLGTLVKFNTQTDRFSPGLGLGLTLGPFNFGVSQFYDDYVDEQLNDEKRYRTGYYSAGIKAGPLIFDYSYTEAFARERHRIQLISGSIYFSRLILSAGHRTENSHRPKYHWVNETWSDKKERTDNFYGAQYKIGKIFLAGLFYNYYLLHEFSLGVTLIF